jgi:hypothetical protein
VKEKGLPHRVAVLLAVITTAAACRSTKLACQPEPVEAPDFAAQIAALSNEVSRLNERLDSVEGENAEIRGSRQFIKQMIEEMRFEPVVEESLIFVPDTDKKK